VTGLKLTEEEKERY
jgi:hypothetical protein